MDWLERQADVDSQRIALIGSSLGGYYAARSAAYERRLRAVVIWGAVWSLLEVGQGSLESPDDNDGQAFYIEQAAWVLGNNDLLRALVTAQAMNLAGHAEFIECPTLILHGEDDTVSAVEQAYMLDAAITKAPSTLLIRPSGQPGATHCSADQQTLPAEQFVPFLLEHLSHSTAAASEEP